MIRNSNENGSVNVSTSVYTDIAGTAALNCLSVKGMVARSVTDGLYHLLRKESEGKGVKVEFHEDNTITIDLHIMVGNGVNLNAVGNSIIDEVRYMVQTCTGTEVRAVNVYIDSIMIDCESGGSRIETDNQRQLFPQNDDQCGCCHRNQ